MRGFIPWLALVLVAVVAVGGFFVYQQVQAPTISENSQDSTSTSTSTGGGSGAGFAEYHSGIKGVVMVGPTCPVERIPPDPACADKPYATLVAVFRVNDPAHAIALVDSNKDGTFQVSLPPGEYVVGAGEGRLPRCAQTPATVGPTGYVSVTVSCDSGIR